MEHMKSFQVVYTIREECLEGGTGILKTKVILQNLCILHGIDPRSVKHIIQTNKPNRSACMHEVLDHNGIKSENAHPHFHHAHSRAKTSHTWTEYFQIV
jgi:hypothetical protein